MVGPERGPIDLSAEEFTVLLTARRSLGVAVGIEEKFNLLLENYAEFERALLDLTLRRTIFADPDWSAFQDDFLTVNRHLANFLSSARSYTDQVDHELTELFGQGSDRVKAVRDSRATEYESRLGYRAMEAIRNYLQHRSFPVHHLKFPSHRDVVHEEIFFRFTITPSVSVLELRKDAGFKSSVLTELEAMGSMVPLTPLVREYVEALGRVHETVRRSMKEDLAQWETIVQSAMDNAKQQLGDNPVGFVMVCIDADGDEIEEAQLFTDVIERRRLLERRSRHAGHISRFYVSSLALRKDV